MPNVKALAQQLEVLRAALGNKPIIITSGYRTPAHNKKVGGADNSQHLTASAADIVVKGVPPRANRSHPTTAYYSRQNKSKYPTSQYPQ
ncbi:D-Ala-D-Ala carboxypeptidase family metallohydrolase [Capnocytophaga bilenii]